jgi:glycosyltransferase involved in cell wall biosynthesis
VIPFYNEEKNVKTVLQNLSQELDKNQVKYEIIAVNNGSFDQTGEIIDDFVKTNRSVKKLVIDKNQGYGYGIHQGLKQCRGKYIGYLWGDNQIPPSITMKIFRKLKIDDLDLCKVTRKLRTESLWRKIYSKTYNLLMRAFFDVDSHDTNGCPKIMKSEVFNSLNLESKDWFLDAEILIKCRKNNYLFKEIPVNSFSRKAGKSKVNWSTSIEFMKNILLFKLKNG